MRKVLLRSGAALALFFGLIASAGAQSLPGSGWYTTATIQNIGNASTTVDLEIFPQGSGNASTASFAIAQNANKIFIPGGGGANGTVDVTPSLGAGFVGSAVVSAGEQIVAIGQIGNNPISGFSGLGTTGGNANEFFRGASNSATTLIYPAVKNKFVGQTTIFSVQAAGSNVTINATIRTGTNATHTFSGSIAANRAINLIPSQFTPPMPNNCPSNADANTSACFGSLEVVATGGNIVGTVIEYVDDESPAQRVQAASLFPSTDAGDTVFCPTIKNTFTSTQRRTTGLTVANTSNQPVTVNVRFTAALPTPGTVYTNSVQIAANKSFAFSPFLNNMGGMPAGTLASARVETADSSDSIVAIVSERNFGTTPVKATLYNCFNSTSATSSIAAPLVKKNVAGVNSGLTIQNVAAAGSAAFSVAATYVCPNASPVTINTPSLAPGASHTFFALNPDVATVSNGNCAVTMTGSGPIVAISQETSDFATGSFSKNLNTKNYEGFNK